MSNPEQKKKGCGCCLGKGCLVLIIIAGIFVGLSVWGYNILTTRVRPYTAQTAAALGSATVSQSDYDAVVTKMDAFKKSAAGSGSTLSLAAQDINALIAKAPEWSPARGKAFVRIAGGEVSLDCSIPLSIFPNLRDRFLNGTVTFTPSMENKALRVVFDDIKLPNYEISKEALKQSSARDDAKLADKLSSDPVLGPVLTKAGTLKVENDAIVLTRAAD